MNLRGLIPLLGGIYCLLVVFRVLPASKNPETNELWLRKFGTPIKLIGPVLIGFGFLELFRVL